MYELFLRATGDGVFSRRDVCINERLALFSDVVLRLIMFEFRVGDSVDMDIDSIPFCTDDFMKRCALGDRLISDSARSCVCLMTTVRSGL